MPDPSGELVDVRLPLAVDSNRPGAWPQGDKGWNYAWIPDPIIAAVLRDRFEAYAAGAQERTVFILPRLLGRSWWTYLIESEGFGQPVWRAPILFVGLLLHAAFVKRRSLADRFTLHPWQTGSQRFLNYLVVIFDGRHPPEVPLPVGDILDLPCVDLLNH